MAEEPDYEKLGRLLVAEGLVTAEVLEAAVRNSAYEGSLLARALLTGSHVHETELAGFLGMDYQVPRLDPLPDDELNPNVARLLPWALLHRSMLLPLAKIGDLVVIAFSALPSEQLVRDIRRRLNAPIKVVLTSRQQIERHLALLGEKVEQEAAANVPEEAPARPDTVVMKAPAAAAVRLSPEEYAQLARAYEDPAVTRWMKVYASAEPLAAVRIK